MQINLLRISLRNNSLISAEAGGIGDGGNVNIDAERILAQDLCKVENEDIAGGSSFIVTGRGGLTPTSAESLDNRDRVVNWADETDVEVSHNGAVAVISSRKTSHQQSQGLMVVNGSLWLTASPINAVLQDSAVVHPDCNS